MANYKCAAAFFFPNRSQVERKGWAVTCCNSLFPPLLPSFLETLVRGLCQPTYKRKGHLPPHFLALDISPTVWWYVRSTEKVMYWLVGGFRWQQPMWGCAGKLLEQNIRLSLIVSVDFNRRRNISSSVSLTTVKEVWIMDHINLSILVPSTLCMRVALKWHNTSCSLKASQWALRNFISVWFWKKNILNKYYYLVL